MTEERIFKLERTPLRSAVTRLTNELTEEVAKEVKDLLKIEQCMKKLRDKHQRLEAIQDNIKDQMGANPEITEADFTKEFEDAEVYREKYQDIETIVEKLLAVETTRIALSSHCNENDSTSGSRWKYKLPALELKKFSGEIGDWLNWWSQFRSIDENEDMTDQVKFQYLLQCMKPGTRAATLVESFPPTPENYPKAIVQLKERFAREDLLVEYYVRELQNMVIDKTVVQKNADSLSQFYDRLETHLRALESLGMTQDKTAYFLKPLVENCLPEETLRLWQRKRDELGTMESDQELVNLMDFIRSEVHNEDRIKLVRGKLKAKAESKTQSKGGASTSIQSKKNTPTTTSLMSVAENSKEKSCSGKECIFCEKEHTASECFKARNMSLGERKEFLKEKRACLSCLKVGHLAKNCRSWVKCMFCNLRHYTLMCPTWEENNKKEEPLKENNPKKKEPSKENANNKKQSSEAVVEQTSTSINAEKFSGILLQTLVVKLSVGDTEIKARALLDSGSQRSYISNNIVKKLRPKILGKEVVIHSMLGGVQTVPQTEFIYDFSVAKVDGSYQRTMKARGQEKICGKIPPCLPECLKTRVSKELGLVNDPDVSDDIDLLIGAEYYGLLQTGQIMQLSTGLTGIETLLGWTIVGKPSVPDIHGSSTAKVVHSTLHSMTTSVENLWKLDILGIEEPVARLTAKEYQEKIMTKFNETVTQLPNGRYEVELPWKSDQQPLADNKMLAKNRLDRVKRSLVSQGIMKDYMAVFQSWLDDGIIEQVPVGEIENFGHYLPHRPVIKEGSATTKIRPVFDASACKRGEPSLNDNLERGPNLIELIPDVLDRFRLKKIGVCSDIEKAFLQISVVKIHRDYLRFFSPQDNRIFRHCRVVFGVSSSPFLLAAVINRHLEQASPELQKTAKLLKSSFYVDNCIASLDNEEELQVFMTESQKLMNEVKMNLRGWVSNVSFTDRDDKISPEVDILGMKWNLKDDTLKCNTSNLSNDTPTGLTKRIILSVAQRLYDPIGFTSPVSLLPKLLIQKLWETKVGWDDVLDEELIKPFKKWMSNLYPLGQISIPRQVIAGPQLGLHVFVDASKDAYAACIFIRSSNTDFGKALLKLVRSKSRVAPKKSLSIPRLELMACTIGVRLLKSFTEATKLSDVPTTYWTDSTTALWWLQHQGPWTVFVNNRVQEIQKFSQPEQWRHVPGELNPADLPSRGCDGQQLLKSEWWEGPTWLQDSEETWPVSTFCNPDDHVSKEQKCTTMLTFQQLTGEIETLFQNISSYDKIVKILAWIKRFSHNASQSCPKGVGPLQMQEFSDAENQLFREIQRGAAAKPIRLHPDTLFKNESGILRVKSKVLARKDTETFCCPVILFGDHYIVKRLIEDAHRKHQHAGTQLLAGVLREKFFIVGGRRAIKKVTNDCQQCRRYRTTPFDSIPVHLPEDRVKEAAVFEISGIDYAGPVFLNDGSKAWICLITCAIYRAIHFELVSSMSTDCFLLALRRFISRRGRPRIIYSDNGSNFVGANNVLKSVNWSKIQDYATTSHIQWNFIPPTAAWWGGWWERLVAVVKNLLKRSLGKSSLTYEEMSTVLCDCEITINSRPLTYISDDSQDLVPLTPALFLNDTKGDAVADLDSVDQAKLSRRVRYRKRLADELRRRFRTEYLGQLFNREHKKKVTRQITEGEVVLIKNPNEKRVNWCIGKVIHLYPGKDGVVRKVKIKTCDSVLERPIQHLYPLEVVSADSVLIKVKANGGSMSSNLSVKPSNVHSAKPVKAKDKKCLKKESETVQDKKKSVVTRLGRVVQIPKRLDLFNCPIYVLEKHSHQHL